jgi:DNA-binding MarR family transcriptional regulator
MLPERVQRPDEPRQLKHPKKPSGLIIQAECLFRFPSGRTTQPQHKSIWHHPNPDPLKDLLAVFCHAELMSQKPATPSQTNPILDLPRLIERMHRRYLDVVRLDMTRIDVNDISPVQVMMLANIGLDEISVRDLIERGYYLGSNASYNLKQLVDCGYVLRQAAARDKRLARLKLSDKGRTVLDQLHKLDSGLADPMLRGGTDAAEFEATYRLLRKLERRWTDAIRYADTADDGLD